MNVVNEKMKHTTLVLNEKKKHLNENREYLFLTKICNIGVKRKDLS